MPLLIAFLVFLTVMVMMAVAGLKLWVRPKEALDRVSGMEAPAPIRIPIHPSLAFHELIKKLGNLVPASPKDVSVMQKRLIRAGIKGSNALRILYGAKILLAVIAPLLMSLAVANSEADSTNKIAAILVAAAAGFFAPNEYVKIKSRRRQKAIQRGLANALDLLVVCVESGLGLDQAMVQVAKELEQAHREITEEFAMINLELKAGKRRVEALRNLADRSAVDDLKKLVAVLIQADRFGTGIAQSLRAHADFMRIQARQIAEEKAAKLGVKLIFPIFFCIMPSLFVVTVGPMAVKIVRELVPMISNI